MVLMLDFSWSSGAAFARRQDGNVPSICHALISFARYQCLDETFPFTAVRFQREIDKSWYHFFSFSAPRYACRSGRSKVSSVHILQGTTLPGH